MAFIMDGIAVFYRLKGTRLMYIGGGALLIIIIILLLWLVF